MIGTINWQSIRPASVIDYERAYLDLPAFNYAATWNDASEIIAQYNYAASNNFVLRTLPTMPTGANYVLAIRYRVGATVYRWKLWGGIGEVMPNIPLYDPAINVIKKNFVLEIWNIAGQTTVTQATAIRLFTSVRRAPSNILSVADYALAAGTEVYPVTNTNAIATTPPTDGLLAWYRSNGIVGTGTGPNTFSSWDSEILPARSLTPSGFSPGIGVDARFGAKSPQYVYFTNSGVEKIINAGDAFEMGHLIMTYYPSAHVDDASILDLYTTAPGDHLLMKQEDPSGSIRVTPQTAFPVLSAKTTFPLLSPYILRVSFSNATGATRGIYRYNSIGEIGASNAASLTTETEGNLLIGGADFSTSEILIYDSTATASDIATAIQYVGQTMDSLFVLPLTFNSGVDGGDNA